MSEQLSRTLLIQSGSAVINTDGWMDEWISIYEERNTVKKIILFNLLGTCNLSFFLALCQSNTFPQLSQQMNTLDLGFDVTTLAM